MHGLYVRDLFSCVMLRTREIMYLLSQHIHDLCLFMIYIVNWNWLSSNHVILVLSSTHCIFNVFQVYLLVHWCWSDSLSHFLFWLYWSCVKEWLLPELCILIEFLKLQSKIHVRFLKFSSIIWSMSQNSPMSFAFIPLGECSVSMCIFITQ